MTTKRKKKTATRVKEIVSRKKRPSNVFDGTLASINQTKLVMTRKDGEIKSLTLSKRIKSTCDGNPCTTKDLKPGRKIRVTTQKTDLTVALTVASLDKKSRFGPAV